MAAVAARLLYAWVLLPIAASGLGYGAQPGADGYNHLARCLLSGNGYRFGPNLGQTMFRLPGYPLFLCGLWYLFGVRLWVVQLIQALLAACACLLIYRIGRRYFSKEAGLLAGLGFALWPVDWVVCARYMTEPVFVPLLVLGLYLALRLAENPRVGRSVALGGVLGLAGFFREIGFLLPVALGAACPLLPLSKGRRLVTFGMFAIVAVVAGLVMSPWLVRGYYLTGSLPVPTTGGGFNLYATVSFSRHGTYAGDLRDHVRERIAPDLLNTLASHGVQEHSGSYDSSRWWTFTSIQDEVRADRVLRRKAVAEILSRPGAFMWTVLGNLGGFWFRGATQNMTLVAMTVFVPLLLLASFGFVRAIRSGQEAAWMLVLLIAYLNIVSAGAIAFVRYSLPATPAVLLLAAEALRKTRPKGADVVDGATHG